MSRYRDMYAPMTSARLWEARDALTWSERDVVNRAEGTDGEVWRSLVRKGTDYRLRRIAVEDLLRERGELS